jgi:hypothetical protein
MSDPISDPLPLEEWEKTYFDTLRNKHNKITLLRMYLDGETPVGVITQVVSGTPLGEAPGFVPIAILADDQMIARLTMIEGNGPESFDPSDFVAEPSNIPDPSNN